VRLLVEGAVRAGIAGLVLRLEQVGTEPGQVLSCLLGLDPGAAQVKVEQLGRDPLAEDSRLVPPRRCRR
jgi:hypothetical protein